MSEHHFPDRIRKLPKFNDRFDAHRLETDNIDIYFATYPAGTEIEPHRHETDNYGVITQGELILIINGEEKHFLPGDWYYIPAGCVHSARFEKNTSDIEFWFNPE